MPTTPVTDWSDAFMTSVMGAMTMFFAAVPRIIGFALILIIGWIVADLIGRVAGALLRTVHFNDLAQRSGFGDFVAKLGVRTDSAGFLASLAKWFMRLIVMVVAFDALGLPAVSDVLRQLLLWLPNLVVAMVVLVIGGLAATALSNLIRAATSQAGFSKPELLGKVASVAVWGFAIVVAVNQLGIAATLVNTLFMGLVGGIALAAGLAFGLGGRDTAAEIVRSWYIAGKQAEPKVERAAHQAERIAKEEIQTRPQGLPPGQTQVPGT